MDSEGLRIGIDARLVAYRRGIGNVTHHLLKEIASRNLPHTFIAYVDSEKAAEATPKAPHIEAKVLSPSFYPLWEQSALPKAIKRDRIDVLHCLANTGPMKRTGDTRYLLTICDVMYLMPEDIIGTTPTLYHRAGRAYRRHVVPKAANTCDRVLTISDCSKNDIVKYLGLKPEKIQRIYLSYNEGVEKMSDDESAPVLEALGVQSPFFFALGALEPRKNTRRIIEAFALFCKRSNSPHRLVVGGLVDKAQEAATEWAKECGARDRVTLLGFVSEKELSALYSKAEAFVWPSLYEGFGIPLLEALAVDTPVITAANGSIPEVVGEAALLCDATAPEDIAKKMLELADCPELASELRGKGRDQVKKFSWSKFADEHIAAYQEIAR
ncbi:MAG: glycosyltransferase family 4 protein [Fimbriimonadaceae bacterium]